jgi:hypothetical protein
MENHMVAKRQKLAKRDKLAKEIVETFEMPDIISAPLLMMQAKGFRGEGTVEDDVVPFIERLDYDGLKVLKALATDVRDGKVKGWVEEEGSNVVEMMFGSKHASLTDLVH